MSLLNQTKLTSKTLQFLKDTGASGATFLTEAAEHALTHSEKYIDNQEGARNSGTNKTLMAIYPQWQTSDGEASEAGEGTLVIDSGSETNKIKLRGVLDGIDLDNIKSLNDVQIWAGKNASGQTQEGSVLNLFGYGDANKAGVSIEVGHASAHISLCSAVKVYGNVAPMTDNGATLGLSTRAFSQTHSQKFYLQDTQSYEIVEEYTNSTSTDGTDRGLMIRSNNTTNTKLIVSGKNHDTQGRSQSVVFQQCSSSTAWAAKWSLGNHGPSTNFNGSAATNTFVISKHDQGDLDSDMALSITSSGNPDVYIHSTTAATNSAAALEIAGGLRLAKNIVIADDQTIGCATDNDLISLGDQSVTFSNDSTVTAPTLSSTTGNITTVNSTTVDTTNLEVSNLKAKDGTACATIADSTGIITIGSSVLTTTDINGGTIDGTDVTVGTGKTLDVSAGTLTLADDQISGDKINGGTIDGITITTLGSTTGNITTVNSTTVNSTTVDSTNLEVSNLKAKDGTACATIADSTGTMTVSSSLVAGNVTVNDQLDVNCGAKIWGDTGGQITLAVRGAGFQTTQSAHMFNVSKYGANTSNAWSFIVDHDGEVKAREAMTVMDTLTCSKSSGTGLTVTSHAEIGGNLDVTGDLEVSGEITCSSDATMKKNIRNIENPEDKLEQLNGVSFEWAVGAFEGKSTYGIIAQDVEEVLPEAVTGPDGMKRVNYNCVVGLLVEALKEQAERIRNLESILEIERE